MSSEEVWNVAAAPLLRVNLLIPHSPVGREWTSLAHCVAFWVYSTQIWLI